MNVGVFGIGSIGGVVASSLISAGKCNVTLFARGQALKALSTTGLNLKTHEGDQHHFNVVDALVDSEQIQCQPPQPLDYLLLCTKAHQVPSIASSLSQLLISNPNMIVVPCTNGLPFWFHPLESTDPDGILSHTIPRKNLLGSQCFISGAAKPDYSLWETHWPSERNTLLFGELDGGELDGGELDGGGATRAQQLADLFQGSRVQVQTNVCQPDDPQHIRDHIFDKLLINCSINTIGALTKLDCGETCETNSPSNRLLQRLVTEAIAVGEQCVPPLTLTHTPQSISKHYNNQYGLKSSMLHDVENHRQLEKGFIVDPLVELGKVYNVPTPCLETVSDLLDVYEHQRVRG